MAQILALESLKESIQHIVLSVSPAELSNAMNYMFLICDSVCELKETISSTVIKYGD
jgi:hypothetical protein